MNRVVPALAVLLLIPIAISGQDQASREAALRDAEMQRQARDRDRLLRMVDSIPAPPPPPTLPPGERERLDFRRTLPQFREAVGKYGEALSLTQDLEKPEKAIEKMLEAMVDYLKFSGLKPQPVKASEFEGFSDKDIVWETLTTAERVDNMVRVAGGVLVRSDKEDVISIQELQFLSAIQADIMRLKWLTAKVADLSRSSSARR